MYILYHIYMLGIVADPVIEAIARLEFEDGLSPLWRLLVHLWWPQLAQDQFCPTLARRGV